MKSLIPPFAAVCLAACSAGTPRLADYDVVPKPREVRILDDTPFRLDPHTVVAYPEESPLLKRNAEFLSEYVKQATGYALDVISVKSNTPVEAGISLRLTDSISHDEGYRLSVSESQVVVEGRTAAGVFYGIQTLRKAMPAVAYDCPVDLPAAVVEDEPRYAYRGMHLDCCRHFWPVDFVKDYIDLLALHNLNTFHWHLTDDQGWRFEVKKYPLLQEISSVRHRTVKGLWNSGQYDSLTVSGYYTQEQMREVVAYAAERYVTIIPEIELPGHALAALAAYPELGCTGGPYEVCPDWGVFPDVFCLGSEETFRFFEEVLAEVMDVFPSKYIHIGGDEAPRDRWKTCPKCQKRIQTEGLKRKTAAINAARVQERAKTKANAQDVEVTDASSAALAAALEAGIKEFEPEDMLQSYCTARVERFLNGHGREIIGWDEILDGELAPGATVMSWRGAAGGIRAARMGHDVVMVPNDYCYFDYYQHKDQSQEPLSIGGYVPLEKVYSLNPAFTLTPEAQKHILGVQANLWTEYIATTDHVEYMLLPRLAALSEVGWTLPEDKNYESFVHRLPALTAIYVRDGRRVARANE